MLNHADSQIMLNVEDAVKRIEHSIHILLTQQQTTQVHVEELTRTVGGRVPSSPHGATVDGETSKQKSDIQSHTYSVVKAKSVGSPTNRGLLRGNSLDEVPGGLASSMSTGQTDERPGFGDEAKLLDFAKAPTQYSGFQSQVSQVDKQPSVPFQNLPTERMSIASMPTMHGMVPAWRNSMSFMVGKQKEPPRDSNNTSNLQSSDISGYVEEEADGQARGDGFVATTLPLFWPRGLEVHEGFALRRHPTTPMDRGRVFIHSMTSIVRHPGEPMSFSADGFGIHPKPWYILQPSGYIRLMLDVTAFLIIMYEVTVTPVVLAWGFDIAGWLQLLSWSFMGFWWLEFLSSFLTGFFREGTVEYDPVAIRHRYLRSWFILDVLVLACDLASLLGGALVATQQLRALRLLRLSRALRAVTVLRVFRVVRRIEDGLDAFATQEASRFVLQVLKMLFFILMGNHILCCVWFAIGRSAHSDTGVRWINGIVETVDSDAQTTYQLAGTVYQYVTSFHWALAQVTLGAIDVAAVNTAERCFNILCLILGLLCGTALVSTLSAGLVDIQISSRDKNEKLKLLRRFLRQHAVGARLTTQVQRYIIERLGKRDLVTEEEVTSLRLLPSFVLLELHFEICRPSTRTHPLMFLWADMAKMSAMRFCRDAVKISYRRAADEVFYAGVRADEAYHMISGSAIYEQDPESAPVEQNEKKDVDLGQWIAEAAIWSKWIHVGTLKCQTSSQVLVISVRGVEEHYRAAVVLQELTLEYCRVFHKRLVAASPPAAPYPDDLHVPFTDYEDLVFGMSAAVQSIIGLHAIDYMKASRWRRGGAFAGTVKKLTQEVQSGTCVLIVDGDGDVRRIVPVVVLHLAQADHKILVQIADLTHGVLEPSLQLPGGKQERDELAQDAMRRIIISKLVPLDGLVEVLRMERVESEAYSRDKGVPTRYIRTICYGKLADATANGFSAASFKVSQRLGKVISNPNVPNPRQGGSKTVRLSDSAFAKQLYERDVFVFPKQSQEGSYGLYAWMTEAEMEFLRSTNGENDLAVWIAGMDGTQAEEVGLQAVQEIESAGKRKHASSAEGCLAWLVDSDVPSVASRFIASAGGSPTHSLANYPTALARSCMWNLEL
mmetsp:Transcript_10689/g.24328  ORF Transcript_10689/g.24328 Transcript_10689/m.24328 type:complete len:1116 (-) Transcript_10689:31-3378(-)